MSGIVGIHYFDGRPVDPTDLNHMLTRIGFRGPDRQQAWSDGSIGFGHCMLYTTPESLQEELPLYVPHHQLAITADARIDNRSDLFQKLGIHGLDRQRMADSELILLAYLCWGEGCVDHLLGDFAFAIWDRRNRQVFCARDHFGVRPFFYHYDSAKQIFLFASDMKAILIHPGVSHDFDEARLAETLIPIWNTAQTVYQSIRRLPPASHLAVSGNNIKEMAYWHVERPQELNLGSEEEYAEGFRGHLEEAIRCRLRSAYPIAAHVSGGLDSSSVAAVAHRMLAKQGEPLHTVSMRFEKVSSCDESVYFREITEAPGIIPHYLYPEKYGPLSVYQDHIHLIEEPVLPFNHHFTWLINRHLHQQGLRVALTGFDGDTIVGHGDGYLIDLMRINDWDTFWDTITAIAARRNHSADQFLPVYLYPYFTRLAKEGRWGHFVRSVQAMKQRFEVKPQFYLRYGLKPILPETVLKLWQNQRSTVKRITPEELVSPPLADRTGLAIRLQQIANTDDFSSTAVSPQLRALQSGIITNAMETITLNSSAYGVESRHPFMDVRFVNYCLSLPQKLQICNGWTRYIFRCSMEGILPETIRWRATKTNMSPVVFHGFWDIDRAILQSAIAQTIPKATQYIDPKTAITLFQGLPKGHGDRDREARFLWQALQFAIWFEHVNNSSLSNNDSSLNCKITG